MSAINIREEGGVRTLHLGTEWIQGAMRIARPWSLELEYTRDMMVSLLLRADTRFPRRVLLIGLGAGSLTKFIYRHFPLARLTVVEINPEVVAVARQFFKLPEDPNRLHIVIGDGADFVMDTDKQYDLILVDGFDGQARPGMLNTQPFYEQCRARLNDSGVAAVNLLSRSRDFKGNLERIRDGFDGRSLALPACDSGNVIALAAAGDPVHLLVEDLREGAQALKERTGLNLSHAVSRLESQLGGARGILAL
jgi:spermidine synthase